MCYSAMSQTKKTKCPSMKVNTIFDLDGRKIKLQKNMRYLKKNETDCVNKFN